MEAYVYCVIGKQILTYTYTNIDAHTDTRTHKHRHRDTNTHTKHRVYRDPTIGLKKLGTVYMVLRTTG